jgi:hypothetical protein
MHHNKGSSRGIKDNPYVENIRKCLHINEVNNEFEFKDGLLYFKELLYIPLGPIQLMIIQVWNNLPAAGHFGFKKTIELISQDFLWPSSFILGFKRSMGIVITGFYYKSCTYKWKVFNFCGRRSVDKDGSFYSMQYNYNRKRDSKTSP